MAASFQFFPPVVLFLFSLIFFSAPLDYTPLFLLPLSTLILERKPQNTEAYSRSASPQPNHPPPPGRSIRMNNVFLSRPTFPPHFDPIPKPTTSDKALTRSSPLRWFSPLPPNPFFSLPAPSFRSLPTKVTCLTEFFFSHQLPRPPAMLESPNSSSLPSPIFSLSPPSSIDNYHDPPTTSPPPPLNERSTSFLSQRYFPCLFSRGPPVLN